MGDIYILQDGKKTKVTGGSTKKAAPKRKSASKKRK